MTHKFQVEGTSALFLRWVTEYTKLDFHVLNYTSDTLTTANNRSSDSLEWQKIPNSITAVIQRMTWHLTKLKLNGNEILTYLNRV